jgi:hypothetical protein
MQAQTQGQRRKCGRGGIRGRSNKRAIEIHTWLRGPRGAGYSHRPEPPHPNPNLNLNILERLDERSKDCNDVRNEW